MKRKMKKRKKREFKLSFTQQCVVLLVALFNFFNLGVITAIVGVVVAVLCARQCMALAHKINDSENIAAWFGVLIGIVGLGVYWIYYRVKLKKTSYHEIKSICD